VKRWILMRLVADGMLGGLARWLRLIGYDTLYFNKSGKDEIVRVACRENRLILTRNSGFVNANPGISVLIESESVEKQLAEAKRKLALNLDTRSFFKRCSICNCLLEDKKREEVENLVPEYVFKNKDKFRRCPECGRVYWDGDHCMEIREVLKNISKK